MVFHICWCLESVCMYLEIHCKLVKVDLLFIEENVEEFAV